MEYRARYNVPDGEESEVVKNEAEGSDGPGEQNVDMKGEAKQVGRWKTSWRWVSVQERTYAFIQMSVEREKERSSMQGAEI